MVTMDDETLPPAPDQLASLLDALRAAGTEVGAHPDEDQLIDYACEALPAGDVDTIDRHLAACARCADRAAAWLDAAGAWMGEAGGQRLARLRERAREAGILVSPPAMASPAPSGGARHPTRQDLASYRADPSRATPELRRHLDEIGCATCRHELDSAVVRTMARLLAIPEAATRFASLWDVLLWHTPGLAASSLRAATPLSAALLALPSTLHFGGAQARIGEEEPVECFVAPPRAYAATVLYTSNGRELPDDAEVFWGHEIWLIQVPWSVAPGERRSDVDSFGLSLRFPGQEVQIIDLLPHAEARGAAGASVRDGSGRPTADVHWNGRISAPAAALPLDADPLLLDSDSSLHLSSTALALGRLSLPPSTPDVRASVAGIGEALWVFELSRPFAGAVGSVWVTAVTDKHAPRMTLEAQLWLEVKGLNGVPARITGGPLTLPVTLVRDPE